MSKLFLLIAAAAAEEQEQLSLLQTSAAKSTQIVHAHEHANDTRSAFCLEDGPNKCWPGYEFQDWLPPGCISQGSDVQGVRGKCDQLVTPARVAAFSKALAKVGCVTGASKSRAWKYQIPGGNWNLRSVNPHQQTDEQRIARVADCMAIAETSKACAGANVIQVSAYGCMCAGGVVELHKENHALTCSVKSLPPEENSKIYNAYAKEAIYNIKEAKELGSCSKGWWILAGGFDRTNINANYKNVGALNYYRAVDVNPAWKAANPIYRQEAGLYPDGDWRTGNPMTKPGRPSDCAKAVKKCIDDGADYCKDPITGGPPKGASMVAAGAGSQHNCVAWFGDVSQGEGAPVGGGQPAQDGARWASQASWLCLVDDEDPEKGEVMLAGAKKSGKYLPSGPKKKDVDADGTPDDAEPLTKEEKAQCKVDKKALREAKKLKRELKKNFKDLRDALREAKEKLKNQRSVVQELILKLDKCP